MMTLDARLLHALHAAAVHLPAGDLAAQLDTRASVVRERVAELRIAGFGIEERPALGFRLTSTPDRLIADDLLARLGPCPLVREIRVFEETDSTNNLASQCGRDGAAAGVAIFAERQNAGRGRFGRRWESASHRGLWFSLVLRPHLPLAQWPRLTTWAAVSIAAALDQSTGCRTAIKWPNDVYLGGRKVAGILVESGTDTAGQPFAVLGIGVNVNHESHDFPAELAEKAGSLRIARGRPLDRTAVAVAILLELEAHWPNLHEAFAKIVGEAGARSFLLGQWVQLRSGDAILAGLAEELDENGHLLLRCADGSIDRLTAGEVTLIGSRPAG
ncbi:MAG: BirA family transcriptional regulator [Chthoniobacter sp.]|jgi:BirA family biotin operon repressor/biotin-[acetyl-CoA-carboxylase] ligase|nr:BirA family transcriptional regulator [Chthoniobacter sp.]